MPPAAAGPEPSSSSTGACSSITNCSSQRPQLPAFPQGLAPQRTLEHRARRERERLCHVVDDGVAATKPLANDLMASACEQLKWFTAKFRLCGMRAVVDDPGTRPEPGLDAGDLGSEPEIEILAVEKQTRVERPEPPERFGVAGQRAANGPADAPGPGGQPWSQHLRRAAGRKRWWHQRSRQVGGGAGDRVHCVLT